MRFKLVDLRSLKCIVILIAALLFIGVSTTAAIGQENPIESAQELFSQGKYEESLAVLDQLLEQEPDNADAHAWKGNVLGMLSQQTSDPTQIIKYGMQALEEFNTAIQLDPNNITARMGRGVANLIALKNADAALPDFQKVVELDPNNVDGHFYLGLTYQQKGEIDKARAEFEKTLELKPDHVGAKAELAKLPAEIVVEVATTDNITFTGNIERSGAPVVGAEVIVKNQTLDKVYGKPKLTGDLGKYVVRYFEGFGITVASTGDEISVVVNGKEELTFTLTEEHLTAPYILRNIDVTLPPISLTVTGTVYDAEFTLVGDKDGLSVKVENPNKNIESPPVPTQDGKYSAILSGEVAAEPGDEIVVIVSDADGNEVGGKSYTFTAEDMKFPGITVNVPTEFQAPVGSVVEIDNIIIKGVIYQPDGVTPVPNAEVVVRNETAGIDYGVAFTDIDLFDVRLHGRNFGCHSC